MEIEKAKAIIKEVLSQMGAMDIAFQETKENNLIVAVFNSKEVTSFVADVPGWTYSGIQLDPSGIHQYKIDFRKTS